MRDPAPRRHHENIVRLPLEHAVADAAFAAAFDDAVYGAVSGAVRQSLEAGRQELDESADRGHRVATGRRIRILHFQPVTRVRRAMTAKLLERLPAARIWIGEDRRRARAHRVIERKHVGAETGQRIAFGAGDWLQLLRMTLGESCIEERHHRDVEAVEPDHGRVARIAVIVKSPRRRDDEVSGMHRRALAVDRGIRAFAFDDEAQRRLRVPVARRDLAGKDELQPRVEAMSDRRGATQARILEDEHATLGFARADQASGLHEIRAHLPVRPERGDAGRRGMRRHQVA